MNIPGCICSVMCPCILALQAEDSLTFGSLFKDALIVLSQIIKVPSREGGMSESLVISWLWISKGLHHGYRDDFRSQRLSPSWIMEVQCPYKGTRDLCTSQCLLEHINSAVGLLKKGFGCKLSTEVGPLIIAVVPNILLTWIMSQSSA